MGSGGKGHQRRVECPGEARLTPLVRFRPHGLDHPLERLCGLPAGSFDRRQLAHGPGCDRIPAADDPPEPEDTSPASGQQQQDGQAVLIGNAGALDFGIGRCIFALAGDAFKVGGGSSHGLTIPRLCVEGHPS